MQKKFHSSIMAFGLMMILVLLSSSPAMSSEIYRAGVLDFPPFYIVKSENEVEGSMADLLRKILDKAGMAYELKGYPPKRLYMQVAEGTTQIWLGIKGPPEFEGKVVYGDVPINEIEIRVYGLEGKPLINSLPELNGKNVITIRGFGYGGMLSYLNDPGNKIATDLSDSHEMAFQKLLRGRGDYVLNYKVPAEETIKVHNIKGLAYTVLKNIKVHLIVSNKTPDAENVVKKMEAAYLALKAEGAI